MLDIFLLNQGTAPAKQLIGASDVSTLRPGAPCWFDLYEPSKEEEQAVEKFLGINLPTRGEMVEIEATSRIYAEGNALYLTTSLVAGAQLPVAETDAVTFVLVGNCLATVRYHDPTPLRLFKAILAKAPSDDYPEGSRVMVGLLDTIIDRLADILEIIGANLDALSREVFLANDPGEGRRSAVPVSAPGTTEVSVLRASQMRAKVRPNDRDLDLRQTISMLGRGGDLISKSRESLVSLNRVLVFLDDQCREGGHCPQPAEIHVQLGNIKQDLHSLLDHANFLSGKVAFLLDATLGLINVEQNQIIKIFSIAAVIFLPPTLVASIYGMNFTHMPELQFAAGYPMAILFMVISAVIPYLIFKHKGWV